MKAYYLIIRTIALTAILVYMGINNVSGQSTDRNFIKTEEMFIAIIDENSIDTILNKSNRKRTTIDYFDGLGRPVQSIILSKSPSEKDIVQHIEYDGLGRQPKNFLPFMMANSNGAFVTSAGLKQITFYAAGTNPDIPETAYPYNETRFEQSPLNRVLESASPGENWNLESGHTIKSHIGSNEVDEVKKWSVGSNGDILKSDSYPAGKLLKNITFDEDNNKSVSYTTTEGLTVLKRNVLNEQNLETYLDTYYVYNDLNLLVCVIMPNANTSQNTFTDFANAFRYKYDGKRRMVEKYLPGTEPVYYVYNKADKLVLEQDGNLRGGINKVWKFYKYDVLGRMINEGIYGYSGSRESLQLTLDNSSNRLYEIKEPGYFPNEYGYSQEAYPADIKPSFVYYYDNYDFNADGNALIEFNQNYKAVDGFLATIDKTPYGMISGKMISNGEIEVFFYDMEGRIIQTKTENYYTTNKYYFNGAPIKTNYKYFTSPSTAFSYTFEFGYDHDWRPTNTSISINNGTSQLLNTMKYTELTALKTKFLHGNATAFLQKQQFAYNIRSWLAQINNIDGTGTDVFAEKLFYETLPSYYNSHATVSFNGNISGMEWYTKDMVSTGTSNGYALNYDGLNRLTGSGFFNRIGSTVSWQDSQSASMLNYGTITGIGSESGITYDKNGNIKTLERKGKRSTEVVIFDSFTYEYDGNKLLRVRDAISGQNSLGDFRNTASLAAVNIYDQNGNLISDADRNMTIQYNQLNLPVLVQFTDGRINNTYRYDGIKTGKTIYDASGRQTLSERYYGNLVLSNNVPARILHADGVIELSSTFQPTYYYHLKDHLGNVRAVVSPGFNNTTVVNQTDEYYPFGMAYTKSVSSLLNPVVPNKYKYNGKEEQEMPGKWLDYGARFYDPQLGRWHSVDPFAEMFHSITPYNYCKNSPINYNDPTGMATRRIQGFDGQWWEVDCEDGDCGNERKVNNDPTDKPETKDLPNIPTSLNELLSTILEPLFGWLSLDFMDSKNTQRIEEGQQNIEQVIVYIETANGILEVLVPYSSLAKVSASIEQGHGLAALAAVPYVILDVIPAKGVSVIGPKSTYREFAKKIGAHFLDVTDEAWSKRKNVEFLQGVVKRGDDVIFAGKFNPAKLDPKSILAQEIRYLQRHGYSWNSNYTRLLKK